MTSRTVTVVNQLGLHARAAARFVHLATRFESQIRVGARHEGDGRQEHHGHSAAGRGARHDAHDRAPTGRTSRPRRRRAGRSSSNPDLVRNRGTPERHRRVARRRRRPRARRDSAHAGDPLSDRARSRRARAVGARARPAAIARAARADPPAHRRAARAPISPPSSTRSC